jgi:hypothetical protein
VTKKIEFHPASVISGAQALSLKRHGRFAPITENSCRSAIDPIADANKLWDVSLMVISLRWIILITSIAIGSCTHGAGPSSLESLDRKGGLLEGQRVTVDVYLLDQGHDGKAAGFPAVGGNTNPERNTPVENGCPTEDLANLLLQFRDPIPNMETLNGRRISVSGIYHAKDIFLERPSLNAMVYYRGFLEDVKIETIFPDSCAKWTHTNDGIIDGVNR